MAQYASAQAIAGDDKSIISTVKGSEEGKQSFASLVSFFGQQSQLIYQIGFLELVLSLVEVSDKCSEIHVVQELLSKLQITRVVFTLQYNDLY